MDNDLASFFRLLKDVRLTPAEHAEILGKIESLTVRTNVAPRLTRVKDPIDTLTGSLKKVSLTPKEKSQMLRTILGNGVADSEGEHSSIFSIFRRLSMVPVFATSFILLLGMGGIAVAAEYALPGDTLYPIKVAVNEKVMAAISLTPTSRARWNVRVAERRLEEAQMLVQKSRLSTEVAAGLQVSFHAHARKAQDEIQRIAASDRKRGIAISEEVETSLETHEQAITTMSREEKREHARPPIAVMRTAVHDEVLNARRIGRMIKNAEREEVQAAAALRATGSGSMEKEKGSRSKNNRHGFTLPVQLSGKQRGKASSSVSSASTASSVPEMEDHEDDSKHKRERKHEALPVTPPVIPSPPSVPGVGL